MQRPTAFFLAFSFVGTLGIIACLDIAAGAWTTGSLGTPLEVTTLLNGRWARGVDRHFERDSAVMRKTRSCWNAMQWSLLRETPEQVVAGREDWFFYGASLKDIEPDRGRTVFQKSVADVLFLASQARRAEVPFVVCLMPSKFRLYPGQLHGGVIQQQREDLYGDVLEALRAAGVKVENMLSVLENRRETHPEVLLFSPADTHCSRAGFEYMTCAVVAPHLGVESGHAQRRLGLLPRIESPHHGDLLNLMGMVAGDSIGRRFSYPESTLVVEGTRNSAGAQVLCLGDSFLKYYERYWPRLIQESTGMSVDARAVGDGFFEQITRVLLDYAKSPPDAVILAMSERHFAPL